MAYQKTCYYIMDKILNQVKTLFKNNQFLLFTNNSKTEKHY